MKNYNLNDPRWRQIGKRLFIGEFDGKKRGAVLATFNQSFFNYALNRGETERVVAAKACGKIDEAVVIPAKPSATGGYEGLKSVDAEEMQGRLRGKATISGATGPFWSIEPHEIGMDDEAF
jgi:hypothetical protein